MRIDWLRRIAGSVFTRLLAASLAAGLLMDFLVFGAIHIYRERYLERYEQLLITSTVENLLADLGNPPDLSRASKIARQTGTVITYDGEKTNWSTTASAPRIPANTRRTFQVKPGMIAGFYHGHHFARVRVRHGVLTFIVPRSPNLKKEATAALFILFGLMTAIMAGTYFYIRWVLKPLRWLKTGAAQVGSGNLAHRVPEKRSDEFRDLAETFNRMTQRIDEIFRAKEQLLLDISHELRSPVTRMKLQLEFLPSGETKESLREDIRDLEQMITQILDTARLRKSASELDLTPLDLAEPVAAAAAMFENRPPGIKISTLPAMPVVADGHKVMTVLKNILENACKYASESKLPVEIALARQDRQALVTVRDHGIGIPQEALPYLFEPFFRVDGSRSRETGGYGLGMSLCKTIMEAHGGAIHVKSTLGEGTTVTLCFPVDNPQ